MAIVWVSSSSRVPRHDKYTWPSPSRYSLLTGFYLLHVSLSSMGWLLSACRGENETLSLNPTGNYRPQTKLREINVFRSICQSFCSQEGRRSPSGGRPPGPPSGQRPIWIETPGGCKAAGTLPTEMCPCLYLISADCFYFTSFDIAWILSCLGQQRDINILLSAHTVPLLKRADSM